MGEESRSVTHVRSVRDELAEEDVLVAVERVDDDVHKTGHLSLELMLLGALLEFPVLAGFRPAIAMGKERGGIKVSVTSTYRREGAFCFPGSPKKLSKWTKNSMLLLFRGEAIGNKHGDRV